MAKIFWLASYPKSGNTWMRALLTNYWHTGDGPADINAFTACPLASDRALFDEMMGVESSDLIPEEIARYRPTFLAHLAVESDTTLYIKVHDAWGRNIHGVALFPPTVTAGAIYLVRNPLDVALSYAHHNQCSVERAIDLMADQQHGLSLNDIHSQLPQHLGAWSEHVQSWLISSGIDVLIVRYEDLLARTAEIFEDVLRYLGQPIDHERVRRAVMFSAFDRLQAQERVSGFQEKQPTAPSFFRSGRAGEGREVLTETQVKRIIDRHGPVMEQLKYSAGTHARAKGSS